MKNIKKYNLFEAKLDDEWGSDEFWYEEKSKWEDEDWWTKPKEEISEESKMGLISINTNNYMDYIQIGDLIYHTEFKWGQVRALRKYSKGSYVFTIHFKGDNRDRDIRVEVSNIYLKHLYITKDLATYIDKFRKKPYTDMEDPNKVVAPSEPVKEVDIKTQYEELKRNYASINRKITELREHREKKEMIIADMRKTIEQLNSKNQKLRKELDEYEGLKDAMKKFKSEIDPFGEETWTKKKGDR